MVKLEDRVLAQVLQVHGLGEAWEVGVIVDVVQSEQAREVYCLLSFGLELLKQGRRKSAEGCVGGQQSFIVLRDKSSGDIYGVGRT